MKSVTEEIINELNKVLSELLEDIIKKHNEISCICTYSIGKYFYIKVFCKNIKNEFEKDIIEQIENYIYFYSIHLLNCEKFLSKSEIKKIRNYAGYTTKLIRFELDSLPNTFLNIIDKKMNDIFPIIDIRFAPEILKQTIIQNTKKFILYERNTNVLQMYKIKNTNV